jgi:hypothetical protein
MVDTRPTLEISMKLSYISITNTKHKENFKVFLEKKNFLAYVTHKLGQIEPIFYAQILHQWGNLLSLVSSRILKIGYI